MSRGLHVLGHRGPLVGFDWLDFASKATGDVAQGFRPTAKAPQGGGASAAVAERARLDEEAANTKWYIAGAVAVAALVGIVVAKVVK